MRAPQVTVTYKTAKPAGVMSAPCRVFTFKPDSRHPYSHPGTGGDIRWGSFSGNFWFWCKAGRTDYEAASIAKRKLQHFTRRSDVESIEIGFYDNMSGWEHLR